MGITPSGEGHSLPAADALACGVPHDLRPGDPRGGAPRAGGGGRRRPGSAAACANWPPPGWSPGNRAGSANAWRRQE